MNFRRILGILILLAGIASLILGMYITSQVEQGKMQVASAQKKVKQSTGLFNMSPYTKGVGDTLSNSAQKKIGEANEMIAQYAQYATWFKIGGVAMIVLGGIIIFIPRRRY